MLKRIDVSDLELGMFVHKLEGNWFRHPFWKAKFVLTDEGTLNSLRGSAVPAVIIDTDKGLDLRPVPNNRAPVKPGGAAAGAAVLAPGARRAARASVPAPAQFDLRSTAPQPLAREFGNAGKVADKSRRVISRVFLEARLGKSINAAVIEPVVEDIFASVQRNPHALNGLMRCKRDNEFVYRHALAVSALMIALARQMKFSAADVRQAGMAGLLIDMGVGHLPVDLAALGGDFRQIDPRIFIEHAQLGHDLLRAGGIADEVALASLHHHERIDGSGYPQGLKGDGIGLLGRMASICDTYDWLVNDSVEGAGLDPAAAVAQLSGLAGSFDAAILRAFADAMGIYPVGSVVLLRSGRLAMVTGQDPADPARPTVRAFWSAAARRGVTPAEIALAQCFGEDMIEATADPAAYGCHDFAALRERLFALSGKG